MVVLVPIVFGVVLYPLATYPILTASPGGPKK
jgi:hypothetical protein